MRYKLKKNRLFIDQLKKVVEKEDITDEMVEGLLKINEGAIRYFDVIKKVTVEKIIKDKAETVENKKESTEKKVKKFKSILKK